MTAMSIVNDLLLAALLAQAPAVAAPHATTQPDACALVADADVRAVLGVAVTERRPAAEQARGLLLSQCYLGSGTPRSVSVAVAGSTRSGGTIVTPRAFWRAQFHGGEKETGEREHETKARPIAGVGDEAFWSGTRIAGALYVLRRNTFIRVSVGGIRDEQERIEVSRRLALKALARLDRS
jgi:hypothetical protein